MEIPGGGIQMDMIKKIAFTASTMLFVLAQIFSFYAIFTSRQEKIDLMKVKSMKMLPGISARSCLMQT